MLSLSRLSPPQWLSPSPTDMTMALLGLKMTKQPYWGHQHGEPLKSSAPCNTPPSFFPSFLALVFFNLSLSAVSFIFISQLSLNKLAVPSG